eukprot:4304338-Pyramimonas_sp.AAC.1
MTFDIRTVFSIAGGADMGYLQSTSTEVKLLPNEASNNYGPITVAVSFPTFGRASTIVGTLDVAMVVFDSIAITSFPEPSYPGMPEKVLMDLVACTDEYQRLAAQLLVTLTNSAVYDVTAYSTYTSSNTAVVTMSANILVSIMAGAATIRGTFCGETSAGLETEVRNIRQAVTSASHTTSWWGPSSDTFARIRLSTKRLDIYLTFEDGTVYTDYDRAAWIEPVKYLQFTSGETSAITIADDGYATIQDNFHLIITLTVDTVCPAALGPIAPLSPFTSVTATQDVYANLEPAYGDVDFGSRYQLQLPPLSAGSTYGLQVRINTGSAKLE